MSTTPTNKLLEVQDLRVHFSTPRGVLQAVRGVSFDLQRGETLGIVGESGSGKSVSALSLLDLLPGNSILKSGRVSINGRSLFDSTHPAGPLQIGPQALRKHRGRDISMIFQEPGRSFDPIYPIDKTMAETILAHYPQMPRSETTARCIAALREVNIPEPEQRITNYPHQFSGGLLQRVMIAIALLNNPEILIADEPTTSLDVTIQAGIIRLLDTIRRERNMAIVFITHDLALISEIAERIIVMYAGLIMEEGPTSEVLSRPGHPYTRALLDTIPRLGQHYKEQRIVSIPGSIPDPVLPEPGCPFAPRCKLVRDECRQDLPPMRQEQTSYRCLIPGAKTEGGKP